MEGIRHAYIKTSTSRKYTKDDMTANHIIEDSECNQYTVDQLLQTVQTGLNPNDLLTMLLGVDGPNTGLNSDMVDDHHASDFVLSADLLSDLTALADTTPFLLKNNYIEASNFNDYSGYIKFKNSLQICWGSVNITPSAANIPTSATVNFPRAFTSNLPSVTVSAVTQQPGTNVLGTSHFNVTLSSTDIWVTRNNTTATPIRYIAVGK